MQSGNDNFNAASDVVRTVSASKAAQEISFTAPAATFGDADSNLDATATSELHDGTSAATIAYRGLEGVVAGDTVELGGGTAAFEDENVGDHKTVGATGFVLSGDDAHNYVLASGPWSTTADITAKELTASFAATSKVYDGTRNATVAATSLPGVVRGDGVTLDVANALFDEDNVGTGKTVTGALSLSGSDAGNYRLATIEGSTTADITPKGLTSRHRALRRSSSALRLPP